MAVEKRELRDLFKINRAVSVHNRHSEQMHKHLRGIPRDRKVIILIRHSERSPGNLAEGAKL